MEKVADVLDRKYPQFNTVTPDCMVSDALYQMCCENVDFLIVLENDHFQGVISDHDIASKVLFANKPLNRTHVSEFMNRTLPVCSSDNSLVYCIQLMERYNARHIAIFDDFNFRGVLCSQDLMQQLNGSDSIEEPWEMQQNFQWNY
jgi:predicted transcriptional regulator